MLWPTTLGIPWKCLQTSVTLDCPLLSRISDSISGPWIQNRMRMNSKSSRTSSTRSFVLFFHELTADNSWKDRTSVNLSLISSRDLVNKDTTSWEFRISSSSSVMSVRVCARILDMIISFAHHTRKDVCEVPGGVVAYWSCIVDNRPEWSGPTCGFCGAVHTGIPS